MAPAKTLAKKEIVSAPAVVCVDARGMIENLAEGMYQSVLRITSKAGTVRANHYHRWDSLLCYLAKGKVRYVSRPALEENAPLEEAIIKAGQIFSTPPMVAHAMHFLEDSEFYAFTNRTRGHEAYEEDIVRVVLIDPKKL